MNYEDLTDKELRQVLHGLQDAERSVKASISEVLAILVNRNRPAKDEGHWTDWGHVPS